MIAWRICKEQFASSALSGEGARLFSGRWNPAGIRMVYCSNSLALAALEVFVHLDPSVAPNDLVSIQIEIPAAFGSMERVELSTVPAGWRGSENLALREIGAEWIRSQRGLALLVPSVVVAGEWNVLLNPAHPDFSRTQAGDPTPFHFDSRMFSC